MRLHLLLTALGLALSVGAQGQAVIEGHVALPNTRSAPVVTKRYEIVSKGGVIAPNPPPAVVYLEGVFPKPAQQPVAQMEQKDLYLCPRCFQSKSARKSSFRTWTIPTTISS